MPRITLVVHNLRSTHNVGAIFRTAEGLGVDKIILSGYSPYPAYDGDSRLPHIASKITSQIHKVALGAEKLVAFEHFDSLDDWLNQTDLPIIALEQDQSAKDIKSFKPPEAFALLLGEEVSGIQQRYLERCDYVVEIPMQGQKESFNVSVATGIALYALSS